MTIRILPSAVDDIRRGFRFYDHKQRGLGEYFSEAVYNGIDSLAQNAGIHPLHFGNFHRKLLRTFPFAVYYRLERSEVKVYAVIDCRRSPDWIRKRISRSAGQP